MSVCSHSEQYLYLRVAVSIVITGRVLLGRLICCSFWRASTNPSNLPSWIRARFRTTRQFPRLNKSQHVSEKITVWPLWREPKSRLNIGPGGMDKLMTISYDFATNLLHEAVSESLPVSFK